MLASSESVDNRFVLYKSIIVCPWTSIWFDFFMFVIFLNPLCAPFFMYCVIKIRKQVLIGACYHCFLPSRCFFRFFICYLVSWNCVSSHPAEFLRFFPDFCRFIMVCFRFRTFGFVGTCFWNTCRWLLESVNIEKFFPFVEDILLSASCIACVPAVNIERNSLVAMQIRCVVAAALTPFSLFEPSYVFILDNVFKSLLISQSCCLVFRRSVRHKFILTLGSPQLDSLIPSRVNEKSRWKRISFKFSFVCTFWILIANGGG